MSFLLDYVFRRPKATVHVLDSAQPQGYATVELRVPDHVLKEFGSDKELFATLNEDARPKNGRLRAFLRKVFIADKAYTFMTKASWDELAAQHRNESRDVDAAVRPAVPPIDREPGTAPAAPA
jgi:hypothetical protein